MFRRSKLFITAIGSLLLLSTPASAGVPVIDVAAIIQAKLQVDAWAQQAKDMGKSIQKYEQQIEQLNTQISQLDTQIQQVKAGNIGGLMTGLVTSGLSVAGQGYGNYGSGTAAKTYLSDKGQCINGSKNDNNSNYQACLAAREHRAGSLQEMQRMLTTIETRETEIRNLLSKVTRGIDPGELQTYLFQMNGLQAQIQNDMARLQLSLAIYKQREVLYQQQQADSAKTMMRGNNQPVSLRDALYK